MSSLAAAGAPFLFHFSLLPALCENGPDSRDEWTVNKLPFNANPNRAVDFHRHRMGWSIFSAALGGVKSRSEGAESWQAVFWRSVTSERMNIVFIRGDGPAEWSSIEGICFFNFPLKVIRSKD